MENLTRLLQKFITLIKLSEQKAIIHNVSKAETISKNVLYCKQMKKSLPAAQVRGNSDSSSTPRR